MHLAFLRVHSAIAPYHGHFTGFASLVRLRAGVTRLQVQCGLLCAADHAARLIWGLYSGEVLLACQ